MTRPSMSFRGELGTLRTWLTLSITNDGLEAKLACGDEYTASSFLSSDKSALYHKLRAGGRCSLSYHSAPANNSV